MVLEISTSVPCSTLSHRCPARPLLVGVGRNVRILDSLGVTRCHGASIQGSCSADSEGVSLLTSGQAATHNTYSDGTYLEQFFQDAS
jgi:hypothetical protein